VELESEWENMLAHQLPQLPPLVSFWDELPALFDWLEGKATIPVLQPLPRDDQEDDTWQPPSTVWNWGLGISLESIRFAAANHLCVELTVGGSRRVIEPYSLRRTKDGHLLVHGLRTEDRQHRSYRVDQIQKVQVLREPFRPVYQIEFTSTEPITSRSSPPRTRRLPTSRSDGRTCVVECPQCSRQFKRKIAGTKLRPHKDRHGADCPSRIGIQRGVDWD
jgi:hypothetical protein